MQVPGSVSTASLALLMHGTRMLAPPADRLAVDEATAVRGARADVPGAGTPLAIALWRAVDLDVSAVIGRRGTAAVLRRALVVVRRTHGWMSEPPDDDDFDACLHALIDVLASQAPEERVSGQHALEFAFHDLLASLVGGVLAAQLLRTAWFVRSSCEAVR